MSKYSCFFSWFIVGILASNLVQNIDNQFSTCYGHDIRELTFKRTHKLFRSGQLTSSSLTKCYLNRIKHLNPHLNAVLEVNPDALEIAQSLDVDFNRTKKFKGNLHGIPILIKDNISTLDKMNTTAGAWVMIGIRPLDDAGVVKKLRESGAIIIGKANMAEWAGFRSLSSKKDWSGRGGRTKNPYSLSNSTSGSSSGSSAAVAANLALASLGSETDGSIVGPAHLCSVVGLKPSIGFTSGKGVIPLAPSQDSVGAITRTVADNIELTYAIAEPELRKILEPLRKNSHCIKPIRAGIIMEPYFNDKKLPPNQLFAFKKLLKSASSKLFIKKYITADISAISRDKELRVLGTEFKHYLNDYLTNQVEPSENNPKSLLDIINYNRKHHIEDLKTEALDLLEFAQNSSSINSLEYITDRVNNQKAAQQTINSLLREHKVDVLIVPSNLGLDSETNTPSAIAGYPIISIPVGLDPSGVPFGISIFGTRGSELTLLQTGRILESFQPRYRPTFIPESKRLP